MKKWESADIVSVDFQNTEDMAQCGLFGALIELLLRLGCGCPQVPPCPDHHSGF